MGSVHIRPRKSPGLERFGRAVAHQLEAGEFAGRMVAPAGHVNGRAFTDDEFPGNLAVERRAQSVGQVRGRDARSDGGDGGPAGAGEWKQVSEFGPSQPARGPHAVGKLVNHAGEGLVRHDAIAVSQMAGEMLIELEPPERGGGHQKKLRAAGAGRLQFGDGVRAVCGMMAGIVSVRFLRKMPGGASA